MKIVIPVSEGDFILAKMLAQQIVNFGGVEDLMFVASWGAAWDMDEIFAIVKPSYYFPLQEDNPFGWPEAPNFMFQHTAFHLAELGNDKPWYWMEADTLPLRPDWHEALQQEYEEAGKPFMGVIRDTAWVNLQTHERWLDGKHMVGCGIYPADFVTRCPEFELADRQPWDTLIGAKVVPQTHNTKLMAHRWQTVNYRRQSDGKLIMDDVPKEDVDSRVELIDPNEVAVVHGVKDSTLYNLLNNATV